MNIRNATALKKIVADHETAPLDDVVQAINIKLGLAVEADNQASSHRLDAARMLLELRRRVEENLQDNWWEWCEGRFTHSRKDIEKLLRLARADDPEAAAQKEKADTRERMRRLRGAHIEHVRSIIPEPEAEPLEMSPLTADPVATLSAAFEALEAAILDVAGDDWRRVVKELGEYRITRVSSKLKSVVDDYGSPRGTVKSAADRAEARAQGKMH
jgi:hypothetical protein